MHAVGIICLIVLDIVTDLINVLPGNSSVNTVQHATIEEAVFPLSMVMSHNSW
jgi:hypothetical protein